MKRFLTPFRNGSQHSRWRDIVLLLGAVFLLAAISSGWSLPAAFGRESTAAEMIADGLPRKKTLKSATRSELVAAVCAAVRKRPGAAAAITPAAVAAHPEDAAEIVGSVLRCSGKLDCEFVGSIVVGASAVEGAEASAISDAAVAKAPDCAETIRGAARRKAKTSGDKGEAGAAEPGALIGTSAGPDEGFNPHETLKPVCDNGTQRAIRISELNDFLRAHPGAFEGSCRTTPQANR